MIVNVNYRNNQYLKMSIYQLNIIFIILFTFFTLLSSTSGQQISSSSNTCSQLQSRTDRLIKRILLLNGNQQIPRNEGDLLGHCKTARKGFTLASKYQQCLPPFPRQILALFISGAGKAVRHVCDDPVNRLRLLDSLTCLDNDNIGRVYSLVSRTMTIVEYIGQNVTSDIMILPYGCCTYHFIYDRGIRLLDSLCPNKSTAVTQLISTLLELTLSEIIEIGCSKYSNLSICAKKIPRVMENIKSARSLVPTSLADRSFIQPVLTIANRLIDDPTTITVKDNDDNSNQNNKDDKKSTAK
ncbi:uncharacterized protein LOC128393554 [Panonychus citri]|uniref:uncharacterized protein LOC128393554 n=1 Tax=Panonychus citri TaxID=50023 RepID=UPI0023076E72|nr:uncharacterized protein LOC128393554 [Panonychus citri]XP_053209713.1 uncharacterized protein LOC128393554 [Panonychus citri]